MFVGRVPLYAAAGLAVAIALIVVLSVAIYLRGRAERTAVRAIWSAVMIAAVVAAPPMFVMLIEPALAERAARGLFIHPSPLAAAIPPVFAVVLLIVAHLLFPRRASHARTLKWRAVFIATVIIFTTLNVMNLGHPGWTGWFGFPFPYLLFSDAQISMNGEKPWTGFGATGVAANVSVLAMIATVLSLLYRRRNIAPAAPPETTSPAAIDTTVTRMP